MDNLTNFFIHANCCAQSAVKNSMDMINWLKNVDSSDKGDLLALIEAEDFFSIVFKLLAQLDEEITCSTQKFSFHCVSHLPEYYKQLTWKTYKNTKRFIDKNVYESATVVCVILSSCVLVQQQVVRKIVLNATRVTLNSV